MIKRFILFIQEKQDSIQFRLLVISILLIICPVFITAYFSYAQYTKNLEQESGDSINQTIVQLSSNLNSYIDGLFSLSQTIYYDKDLMDSLAQDKPDSAYGQLQKEWDIENQLSQMFINSRSDILNAYIISDNIIYDAGIYSSSVNKNTNFTAYPWYNQALSSDKPICVPSQSNDMINYPNNKVFSIIRRINSIQKVGDVLGVLRIDVDYSSIKSICDKVNMGADGGLLIEDQNNSMIYSSIKNKDYDKINTIVKQNHSDYIKANIQGEDYIVNSAEIPNAQWTVITINSVNELNKTAIATRNITIFIAVLSTAIVIVILLLFAGSFLKPLLRIVTLMKQVQAGDFNVFFPDKRKDEIGYLGSSFNAMMAQINNVMKENTNLVKEVYEIKLLQNEAQINALFSQIKPHFIFNTLNMISLLIRCGKTDLAIDNIDKLSDLLRWVTRFDSEISIEEEVRLLDSYLSIQHNRYNDRLEYEINLDLSRYSFKVPALIFQPIVENSIIHGCEKRHEKTFIKIYSSEMQDHIAICFEDNAGGMEMEILEKLRQKINSENSDVFQLADQSNLSFKSSGIGLLNVNRRLKLKYGNAYGLQIDSKINIGTIVRIILPKYPKE